MQNTAARRQPEETRSMSGGTICGDDYVRYRLLGWGREFRLGREIETLGIHRSNLLQVLIEHKGEMPSRVTGYKPLTIPSDAMEIEDVVHDIHAVDPELAIVLRVYYCGSGNHSTDRLLTAARLLRRRITRRRYYAAHDAGFHRVAGFLSGVRVATRRIALASVQASFFR
jgi:hypothetical protein